PARGARLDLGHPARGNQHLDLAMVAGQPGQPAIAQQVDATIARPDTGQLGFVQQQRRHGRTGTAILPGMVADTAIGTVDTFDYPGALVLRADRYPGRGKLLDDDAAGNLFGRMATHAVSDRPDTVFRQGDHAVLILL